MYIFRHNKEICGYVVVGGGVENLMGNFGLEGEEKMEQKKAANPSIEEVLAEKDANKQKEIYNEYVSNMTPKHSCFWNCIKAFLVGGSICLLGEILIQWYQSMGNDRELAGLYGTLSLILISILLTGFNVYQKLGQFGGAGSIVPITGFANSVASPALEFGVEGEVFGKGCQIFKIAGPVILYGIFSSWVLGVIYWLWKMM